MAPLHRDQVKNTDFITLLFEEFSRVPYYLTLRIEDHKRRICLHQIRFAIEACFTGTGAAANQRVQIPSVLLGVQPDPHVLRHELVFGRW